MSGPGARRSSYGERRERRAAVEDPQVVLEAAARFLEARSRSVAEVRRRLTTAGYRPDLVEDAIARFLELGMLDDRAFARQWVESRDRARPRGERAIREELRQKGVDRAVIEETMGDRAETARQAGGTSADLTAAERLLARHARALQRIADPRQRRQRAYALLARNGFDPDTCRATAAALPAMADGDDEPADPVDPA